MAKVRVALQRSQCRGGQCRGKDDFIHADITVCKVTLMKLVAEIFSPVNRRGAQWRYHVHEPTQDQLVENYCETGGFQRFIEYYGDQNARFIF